MLASLFNHKPLPPTPGLTHAWQQTSPQHPLLLCRALMFQQTLANHVLHKLKRFTGKASATNFKDGDTEQQPISTKHNSH